VEVNIMRFPAVLMAGLRRDRLACPYRAPFIKSSYLWDRSGVSKSIRTTEDLDIENTATFLAQRCVSNRALHDTLFAEALKRAASIERVALYARVSTKDGRQDTENQLIALREYCAKQCWEVAGEYVDHETGGHSRRPHFQQMFADARQRKFDLVLFWSLDRLSREGVSATLNHLERLPAWNGDHSQSNTWTLAEFSGTPCSRSLRR
jgi:hypothetical protein